MKKYGVMIVGTGWVSGEHIRAFEMTERAQVTAIVSRSREKGEAKMREYGLEGRCKVYTDYQEGLKDPNVDIVVICTPNDMHCEQTILAAEAGKHILIEKPVALTWEDTKRMDEAVRKLSVDVQKERRGQLPAGRRLPRRGCHAVVYAGRGGVRLRPVQQNAHGSRV